LVFNPFIFKHFLKKRIKLVLLFIPVFSMVLVLIGLYLMRFGKYGFISVLLSGRFYFYKLYFNDFSTINYFIGKTVLDDTPLDNYFLAFFAGSGIIGIAVFYFLYIKFILDKNTQRGYICSIVLVLLISSIFECVFMGVTAVGLPLFWLLFYKSAYKNQILENKEM
jgi:hypothetical protein